MNRQGWSTAFVAGLLLGSGLILSGMSQPPKVLAFLDITGVWDPSLAFVMAGAIGAALPAFVWCQRSRCTLAGAPLNLSSRNDVDLTLVLGSLMFGVGWGLIGLCPGPALVGVGFGSLPSLLFVALMILGQKLTTATRRG